MPLAYSSIHDWLLPVPRRQSHATLRGIAHEDVLAVRGAHAQAPLRAFETGLVVQITIGSAAPGCLQCTMLAIANSGLLADVPYHVESEEGI